MSDQKPERVRTILDDSKLSLTGRSPGGRGPARLSIKVWENNPRINVWTGVESDNQNDKSQTLALDAVSVEAFFEILTAFANGNDRQQKFTPQKPADKSQGFNGEPVDIGHVILRRNDAGFITIALNVPNSETRCVFEFRNVLWTAADAENNKYANEVLSRIACIAWVNAVRSAVRQVMARDWKHIDRQFNKGGGNRGNWGNKGGDGGGWRGGQGGSGNGNNRYGGGGGGNVAGGNTGGGNSNYGSSHPEDISY